MLPVFSGAKANAILAKDTANVRSAYSEQVVKAMTDGSFDDNGKITFELDVRKDTLGLDESTQVSEYYTGLKVTGIRVYTKGAKNGNLTGTPTTNLIKVDEDVTLTLKKDS